MTSVKVMTNWGQGRNDADGQGREDVTLSGRSRLLTQAATAGYSRDVPWLDKAEMELGADITFYRFPSTLNSVYGSRPLSMHGVLRVSTAVMRPKDMMVSRRNAPRRLPDCSLTPAPFRSSS